MTRPHHGEIERIIARVVRPNERRLVDKRFERGHDVLCRFCGHKSLDHEGVQENQESTRLLKSKRLTLWVCSWTVGYIPANLSVWLKRERAFLAGQEAKNKTRADHQITKARRYV